MKLQESNLSDLILHADNSKTVEDFLKKVEKERLAGKLSKEELIDYYNSRKNMDEVLPKSADAGEYIKDFEKSKAPQFKGKSKKKRREMAVAAFMAANKGKMKKEDILKAVKEVLAENTGQVSKITGRTGETEVDVVTPKQKAELEKAGARVTPMEEDLDLGHQDDEPHMIKSELYKIAKYALELYKMVDQFEGKGEVDFPAWWQSKITKANAMIGSAKHYLEFELTEPAMDQAVVGAEVPVAEKLDPVGHEDKDIDNDGDVDKTDKYLKNRRVKIGQAIASHKK